MQSKTLRVPYEEVLPTLVELALGFVPFSPLGRGFVTGKIGPDSAFASDEIRNTIPRFAPEARTANQALVDLLSDMAQRKTPRPRRSRSPGY